ncbi:MAG: response regulator [Phycisphaerae bacterium]|nr:response regulator [Phycisphaerae bacterium]
MPNEAKILIIDDDAEFRDVTRLLLESRGYTVREAVSGHDGIDVAREFDPDLIVLDIMMESPVEGYTVVHALHEQAGTADTPIIMVSSVQDDPANLFPMSGDVPLITPDAYFTKPIEVAKFLACVDRML